MHNPLMNQHHMLGYIHHKIRGEGELFADLSRMSHPYELEQIESLNKIDQAAFFASPLQSALEQGDLLSDPEERQAAETNLKCLKVYRYQQELRSEILANYMSNKVALEQHGL